MKQEIESFILKYYALFKSAGLNLNDHLYDYNQAYESNGNYIDYVDYVYQYGSCERGVCELIFQASDIMDCMYFPVRSAIHNMAFEYELKNRVKGLDTRILAFGMMLYFMNKLNNKEWDKKLKSELLQIIQSDNLAENLIYKIAQSGRFKAI